MADFFSNLILRSAASGKTSGAVVQPRLPSLFESTSGTEEIPSPAADSVLRESFSPAQEENSAPESVHDTKQHVELSTQPSTVTAGPPEYRLEQRPESKRGPEDAPGAGVPEKDSGPGAAVPVREGQPGLTGTIRLPERHPKAPDPTVRTAQAAGSQPLLVLNTQPPADASSPQASEPGGTVLAPAPAQLSADVPGIDAGPAARVERASAPQAGTRLAGPRQVDDRPLSWEERVIRPAMENHTPASVVGPRTDSRPSASVLRPVPVPQPFPVVSRPGALKAQAGQEQESVVQIHIGRIEVRAVTPPAVTRTVQAAPPQPKMSLDDYLRQREEKK